MGNLILGKTRFNTEEEPGGCRRVTGQVKEKDVVLVNIHDLLHPDISEDKVTTVSDKCLELCDPGPHVFLLVLQPEGFTE